MLYHASRTTGLRTLRPHISTHKKAYVYAIENMVTGMLFGVKHDDFDFIILTDENNKPIVYECYPDAFQKIYQGKGCSIYEVSDVGFEHGMTSWSPELICESEVAVINEIIIDDLYKRLLEEEQRGNLQLQRYVHCDEYRKKISEHIIDRIFRFEIDLNKCMEQDDRFSVYYKDLIQALLTIMDGHLLR